MIISKIFEKTWKNERPWKLREKAVITREYSHFHTFSILWWFKWFLDQLEGQLVFSGHAFAMSGVLLGLLDPLYLVVLVHRLVWWKPLVIKWSPPKRTSWIFSILWHTEGRKKPFLQWCNPRVMIWSPPKRTSNGFSTLWHMSKNIPVLRNVHRPHQRQWTMPRCLRVIYLRNSSWLPNSMVLSGVRWQLLICWICWSCYFQLCKLILDVGIYGCTPTPMPPWLS